MNRQFPALSGVAMILIVLNHTIELGTRVPEALGYPPNSPAVRAFLSVVQGLGVFAVPSFLFISGAFIAYAARGVPPVISRQFLLRSLSHILWPYLVWSAAFYLVVALQFGETYSPAGYLKNLLVGYPFHFIPLLLLFYVVSPVLVRMIKARPVAVLLLIGSYQCVLLLIVRGKEWPDFLERLVPPGLGGTLADWAIFLPLGMAYGLNSRDITPVLRRLRLPLAGLTAVLFLLTALHYRGILHFPLAGALTALSGVLLLPAIDRDSIPGLQFLEEVGKRSFGLYLTHLIVLDIILWGVGLVVPVSLSLSPLHLPFLLALGIGIPLVCMRWLARSRAKGAYRYLLG